MLELEHTRDEINLKLIKEEMKKPTFPERINKYVKTPFFAIYIIEILKTP